MQQLLPQRPERNTIQGESQPATRQSRVMATSHLQYRIIARTFLNGWRLPPAKTDALSCTSR